MLLMEPRRAALPLSMPAPRERDARRQAAHDDLRRLHPPPAARRMPLRLPRFTARAVFTSRCYFSPCRRLLATLPPAFRCRPAKMQPEMMSMLSAMMRAAATSRRRSMPPDDAAMIL